MGALVHRENLMDPPSFGSVQSQVIKASRIPFRTGEMRSPGATVLWIRLFPQNQSPRVIACWADVPPAIAQGCPILLAPNRGRYKTAQTQAASVVRGD